ncbi:MAG: cytochrome c3 family protein [Dehalococcoidia bacterium]|nr:cytochrome c3 family protein [Dehalococcoidia bacterium]
MRKTALIIGLVAGIAVALLAGLGTSSETASADAGPHVSTGSDATPDKCASCHRLHSGQNEFLLKQAGSVEDFCFACHGNGGPGSYLAVEEGTSYGDGAQGLRAGGFEEARIDTTDPNSARPAPTPIGYAVTIGVLATKQEVKSQHAVDGSAGTMWGYGVPGTSGAGISNELECTSCHDPHGNGNYRILRSVPTGSDAAGYTIPDTYPKAAANYTTSNYFNMNHDVDGNGVGDALPGALPLGATPAPGQSIFVDTSRWCSQCHTRYLAQRNTVVPTPVAGSVDPNASRMDSGDDIFTFRHTSAGWGLNSSAPSGVPGPNYGKATFNNRACITCHATHGSNASMPGKPAASPAPATHYSSRVPWPDGSTINPENDLERASLLKMNNRGMCKKCHSAQ